ncbi:MAG: hypothetical protein GY945_14795 [Rhodobacteraceae bacterium]|nr:hypothetical protein [Paracoccaceae bacterium]
MLQLNDTSFQQAEADFPSDDCYRSQYSQEPTAKKQYLSPRSAQKPARQTGIAPEALIETDTGPVRARDITDAHNVLTLEHGYRPVLWAGRMRQQTSPGDKQVPVHFNRGCLGVSDLGNGVCFAPQQHLLLRHALNELLFCSAEVLARACDLTHLEGVSAASQRHMVNWVHLLFDRVEIIQTNGLWVESLAPDMPALRLDEVKVADGIEATVPSLRYEQGRASYLQELPVLNASEVRMLEL